MTRSGSNQASNSPGKRPAAGVSARPPSPRAKPLARGATHDSTLVAPSVVTYELNSKSNIQVKVDGETVWLTQAQMCQLFGRDRSVITRHINNALREGEISEKSNVQNLHIANSDKPVKYYDLDVIISVGYRVKSLQGTQFRRWATRMLKDMLLRRVDDMRRVDRLETRMTEVETDVAQIKGGMQYLIKQLSAPPDPPRRRIGFGASNDDTPTKPYAKLT